MKASEERSIEEVRANKEAYERARALAIEKGLYIYGVPDYSRREPGRDTEDHPAKRSKR